MRPERSIAQRSSVTTPVRGSPWAAWYDWTAAVVRPSKTPDTGSAEAVAAFSERCSRRTAWLAEP